MLTEWEDLVAGLADTSETLASAWSRHRVDAIEDRASAVERHGAAITALREVARLAPDAVRARLKALADTTEDLPSETATLRRLARGILSVRLGDTTDAVHQLDLALVTASQSDDAALRLHVHVEHARALSMLGDVGRALVAWRDGIALARELGERRFEGILLASLGFLHGEQDEPEPYAEHTLQALAIFREVGDEPRIAHCLCNLGGALSRMGRLDEARAAYDESGRVAERLGARNVAALVLAGSGAVDILRGAIAKGVAGYVRSIDLLTELGDAFQVGRHQVLLGRALLEAGLPREARPWLEAAIRTSGPSAHHSTAWQAQALLSQVLEAQGDLAGALAALRAHTELKDRHAEARLAERLRAVELRHQAEAARQQAALARQQARTDELTGLHNRRYLVEFLAQQLARSGRTWQPLSLLLVDVDRFKAINDRHGHMVGDEVLVGIASLLRSAVRSFDVLVRWGGEEFCLVVLDAPTLPAISVARRVCDTIGTTPIVTAAGELRVTVSIGIADLGRDDLTSDSLLRRADAALYEAKRQGRGRVVGAPAAVG